MGKYWQILKMRVQIALIYRGNIVLMRLSGLLLLTTLLSMWMSTNHTGQLGGYSLNSLISYYLVGFLLNSMVFWFCTMRIKTEITEGSLGVNALIKQISYYGANFFKELGWHLFSPLMGVLTLLIVVGVSGLRPEFNFTVLSFVSFLFSVGLGSVLFYNLSASLGVLAFWTTQVGGISSVMWMGVFLLGGQSIPLSFFPDNLRKVIDLLPFRYVYSFTLEIYTQKVTNDELVSGFATQIVWIAATYIVYQLLWKQGLKKYSAFGG